MAQVSVGSLITSQQTTDINLNELKVGGASIYLENQAYQGPENVAQYQQIQSQSAPAFNSFSQFINTQSGYSIYDWVLQIDLSAITSSTVLTAQVSTLTLAAAPTLGTYAIRFNGYQTAPLAYNTSAANVAAAINGLASMQNINGVYGNNYTVVVNQALSVGASTTFTWAPLGAVVSTPLEYIRLTSDQVYAQSYISTAATTAFTGLNSAVVTSNNDPYYKFCRPERLISRIDVFAGSGGSQLLTVYGEDLATQSNLFYGFLESRARSYSAPGWGFAASRAYLPLNFLWSFMRKPFQAYLLSQSSFYINVYMNPLLQCIDSNYTSTALAGASASITAMSIRPAYQQPPPNVVSNAVALSFKNPIYSPNIASTRVIYPVPAGTTQISQNLAGIVGPTMALVWWVIPSGAVTYQDYVNYQPIAYTNILSSSSQSITGQTNLDSSYIHRILHDRYWYEEFANDNMPKLAQDVQAPSDKVYQNVYSYSFSNNPISDMFSGTASGVYPMSGQEQLQVNFPSAVPSGGFQLYVIAYQYAALRIYQGNASMVRA